jgi:hypothetical protein
MENVRGYVSIPKEDKDTVSKMMRMSDSFSVWQGKNIRRGRYIYEVLCKNGYSVELIRGLSMGLIEKGTYNQIAVSPQFARGKVPLTNGILSHERIKSEIDLLLHSLEWQRIENAIEESGIEE